jgi:Argonaute linker 1 domain
VCVFRVWLFLTSMPQGHTRQMRGHSLHRIRKRCWEADWKFGADFSSEFRQYSSNVTFNIHRSVRPTINRLLVNIDIATAVMLVLSDRSVFNVHDHCLQV